MHIRPLQRARWPRIASCGQALEEYSRCLGFRVSLCDPSVPFFYTLRPVPEGLCFACSEQISFLPGGRIIAPARQAVGDVLFEGRGGDGFMLVEKRSH